MELQGNIVKVFATGARDWASIRVKLNTGDLIVAAGTIPAPSEGFPVILNGEYVNDPKYGRQFKVKSAIVREEITSEGIKKFLHDCISGIGEKKADAIVNEFGKDTVKILQGNPMELLKINGIGKSNITAMQESLENNRPYLDIFVLTNGGITFRQAKKILKKYGEQAIAVLQNNPYQLMYDIDGFGYKKADKIARAAGVPEDSAKRVSATIYYALDEAAKNEGHCFLSISDMQKRVLELLHPIKMPDSMASYADTLMGHFGSGKEAIDDIFRAEDFMHDAELYKWALACDRYTAIMADAIAIGIKEKHLAICGDSIYKYALYSAEKFCAEAVLGMLGSRPPISFPNINERMRHIQETADYNREQLRGIYNGLTNRLSVITGGPGRGKTTVIREIIKEWEANEETSRVILLAPTGRASQRMSEQTKQQAGTIHMFRMKLMTGQENVSGRDLVIIDESSMIDIPLAATCLHMFRNCANLIFVGDADQLASIGAGKFLKDLIECEKVPVTKLIECYRNNGSIVRNSISINEGKGASALVQDEQFRFIESDKKEMVENILKEYDRILSVTENGKKKYKIADIGVLSPMNSVSSSSVSLLNKALRDKYNPADSNTFGRWRVHDRVMQTKNNYNIVTSRGLGIFNGDTGEITSARKLPGVGQCHYQYTIQMDDGKSMELSDDDMEDMALAYAITIHKSQGSEYPWVIIALNTDHFIMLKRNLFYTGETRAKDGVTLIGSKKAAGIAMRTAPDEHRNTGLADRIQNIIG